MDTSGVLYDSNAHPNPRGQESRRSLQFDQLVDAALGFAIVPGGLLVVLAQPQMLAMAISLVGLFIYVTVAAVIAMAAAAGFHGVRQTERRKSGQLPIQVESAGVRFTVAYREASKGEIPLIAIEDIDRFEIYGVNNFAEFREIVLVMKGGRRVSTGYRHTETARPLAQCLHEKWPSRCVFKEFLTDAPRSNPFAQAIGAAIGASR